MLEPCDAKVSRTVLRGLGDRKVARLLGKHAKVLICGRHFGALVHFAISGTSNAGSARSAIYVLRGLPDGAYIIASLWRRVGQRVLKTAFYSIQNATTRFTALNFPYQSRVSLKEAFEGLEPCDRETITHGS
jgi:hypothetical protein